MAIGGPTQKQPILGTSSREAVNNSNAADDAAGGGASIMAPPPATIRLWIEVAAGIDKSQTVVWKNAVDSLEEANRYLLTSTEARRFVEGHMRPVISILLEQQPSKIGQMEKNCVEESLRLAVMIVSDDLKAKADPAKGECLILDVLAAIFNRKKIFYKGSKPSWNVNLAGLPEVRQQTINKFRSIRGFSALGIYLSSRVTSNQFPASDVLHQLLNATADVIMNIPDNNINNVSVKARTIEDEALCVAQAVMDYMGGATEDALKRQAHDSLSAIRYDVQRIFEKLAPTRRKEAYAFYEFWRALTLKLITSQSLPLKLFGWEQVGELIDSSVEMRPPPKAFILSNAGCTFVNGKYMYSGPLTEDGFARSGSEISYVWRIAPSITGKMNSGKMLTLFRCTMRSHQKWWFLSEADEEQPGTDKDIDYYSHKSKPHEEAQPPLLGWTTCRNSGIDPPPTLRPEGLMVPEGEEENTLEHQLAKWAIENEVIELVLGDSVHREVVARSVPLIKFLTSMCCGLEETTDPIDVTSKIIQPSTTKKTQNGLLPATYCLKSSHLLLAWKTCTSKADAAVSAEVYNLLVSILPSLPDNLAIPLLSSIQESLRNSTDKRNHLLEVAEFCATLANTNHIHMDINHPSENSNASANNNPNANIHNLSDKVRTEVLKLLWEILTHPDASSLKSYDRLKSYVTHELSIEPMGRIHRENFLVCCKDSLKANAVIFGIDVVDEILALRMVKLTRFVLEACPRDHAVILVTIQNTELANLLFRELLGYMKRRCTGGGGGGGVGVGVGAGGFSFKKTSSNLVDHHAALSERLNNLRYAYGLSPQANMTSEQLDTLWELCSHHSDREVLMIFLANASFAESSNANNITRQGPALVEDSNIHNQRNQNLSSNKLGLDAAFNEQIRLYAFQNLFCDTKVDWDHLGEGAYHSFQMLFKGFRKTKRVFMLSGPALDALWTICLQAGNDNVAAQAMEDLLAVYNSISATTTPVLSVSYSDAATSKNIPTHMNINTDDTLITTLSATSKSNSAEDNFVKRVFDCLDQVKDGLESGVASSERSAKHCLRILNAAAGQGNGTIGVGQSGMSNAAILSLSKLKQNASVQEALHLVPHGMRGQSCYRTIGIVARAMSSTNQNSTSTISPNTNSRISNNFRFSLEIHPLETLISIKKKVAIHCSHNPSLVKATSITGRQSNVTPQNRNSMSNINEANNMSLSAVSDECTVSELGITNGCELIFFLATTPTPDSSNSTNNNKTGKKNTGLDLSVIFQGDGGDGHADHFFDTLLAVLEALPSKNIQRAESKLRQESIIDAHHLVWDLLLAMPTNKGIIIRVRSSADSGCASVTLNSDNVDRMMLDTPRHEHDWNSLLNVNTFHRSVYIMQVIDSYLQPATETLSSLPSVMSSSLQKEMLLDASSFRMGFIDSGGFDAVLHLFSEQASRSVRKRRRTRMANAVALRIIKSCIFGNSMGKSLANNSTSDRSTPDSTGKSLLASLSDPNNLLQSLTAVVASDPGVSHSAILDVLQLLRLLFLSDSQITVTFSKLPEDMAKQLVTSLLLWEYAGAISVSTVNASTRVRKTTQEMILMIPSLCNFSLPWLITALEDVDAMSDSTTEFFDVLKKLVEGFSGGKNAMGSNVSPDVQLKQLATAVCRKLAIHPRPTSDSAIIDFSTGVICGCLKLLRALIETAGSAAFREGSDLLLKTTGTYPWSNLNDASFKPNKGMLGMISSPFRGKEIGTKSQDPALIDLMGVIFDGFLSSAGSQSSTAICCDKDSRQLGFDVIAAAARSCDGGEGYLSMVSRVKDIIKASAPSLRHRWSFNSSGDDGHSRIHTNISKYSGLRNQGCTCYMNSFLQQLRMMPGLQKSLCSASLPSSLRSYGTKAIAKGSDLVGKKISIHWESGVSHDAKVEGFDEYTGMHIIRYFPLLVASVAHQNTVGGGMGHHQSHHHQPIHQEDVACLPDEMSDEFILSEGRPGKETGVFDVVPETFDSWHAGAVKGEISGEDCSAIVSSSSDIKETEDEASSRRLLEELQRTFVHLQEGSRGRCFDPRSLVEASACLKLEFDVWQQNDASEFAMKLLDRLEISLKRWAPKKFKYLTQTFGLKQTKQKICKECGLKTNREENLMNIDCQIRGKSDIHEALSTMCEVEFMEGDNKVFCDRCKKKCDTVLRTAISALPDMLILSLKRFDLDYTTFETVKLNSRCAFGQTLNMKRYSLEGVEVLEGVGDNKSGDGETMMDTADDAVEYPLDDPLSSLPDENYEYKLVGVLVHAGVAQGGHYYSFIKDRNSSSGEESDKWYRFDDEDVTPFDSSSIEVECFGGKIKKETKWPTGQVHISESEQFANALMLFYEKVKPSLVDKPDDGEEDCAMDDQDSSNDSNVQLASGYDVFQPDVRKSNTTHSWHNFLFDAEFQSFSKGFLCLCLLPSDLDNSQIDRMEVSTPSSSPSMSSVAYEVSSGWKFPVVQMSLLYVFEILLHSSDREALDDWIKKLTIALANDKAVAKWFVHELARRTASISANWLRVYCADCTEENSRMAAVTVMASALQSCVNIPAEQSALHAWTQAMKLQSETFQRATTTKQQNIGVLPTMLEGNYKSHEDLSKISTDSSVSSIGIIISSLNCLLEVAPRTWRHNAEFSCLIRDISSVDGDLGGDIMRMALIQAQIPARLICLAIRDRSPSMLKQAFPGSSVSYEIAEAMIKNETPASSHLLPMAGGPVGIAGAGGGTSVNNAAMPSASDHVHLLEALGCIIGAPGVKRIGLVCEVESLPKGRSSVALSKEAQEALSIIFHESKSSESGMGQREITNYMHRCGVDMSTIPPQKISSILSKYPTTDVIEGGKEYRHLNLEGFLAYYRDTAQTNESQVRSDLHTFGFRQDLTRRAEDSLYYNAHGHKSSFQSVESVAVDVGIFMKGKQPVNLGLFAETGLLSFHLHSLAYSTCEPLAECILAKAAYGKDTTGLMVDSLKALSRAPTGWAGTETFNACLMIFKVLVSLPDERQLDRIAILMESKEKAHPPSESSLGLLVAAKEVSTLRAQHYASDFRYSTVERYINAVKELSKLQKVHEWMSKHRDQWIWMDQWLGSDGVTQQQFRSDLSGRRDVHPPAPPINHSDSDMNPGMGNESDDDDDNSRYDQVDGFNGGGKVIVHGAGVPAVNGTYILSDECDTVGKYVKDGVWKTQSQVFSLFRCQLSDHTRRWYISIVPKNHVPGTNKDIDFYSAPATGIEHETPPDRWTTAKEGLDKPPVCTWKPDDELESSSRMWNGDGDGDNVIEDGDGSRELGIL